MDTTRPGMVLAASALAFASLALTATPASAASAQEIQAARSACEAALAAETADGQSHNSRLPCHAAAKITGQAEDMRNEVRALVGPAAHPSFEDLGIALMLVEAAVNKAADQPWGH